MAVRRHTLDIYGTELYMATNRRDWATLRPPVGARNNRIARGWRGVDFGSVAAPLPASNDAEEIRLSHNILEALADTAPALSSRKCKIQRWLDDIAPDTAGRDDLVATMGTTDPQSPHYRTLDQLDRLTQRLGLTTSIKSIGDHRKHRCRCYS